MIVNFTKISLINFTKNDHYPFFSRNILITKLFSKWPSLSSHANNIHLLLKAEHIVILKMLQIFEVTFAYTFFAVVPALQLSNLKI